MSAVDPSGLQCGSVTAGDDSGDDDCGDGGGDGGSGGDGSNAGSGGSGGTGSSNPSDGTGGSDTNPNPSDPCNGDPNCVSVTVTASIDPCAGIPNCVSVTAQNDGCNPSNDVLCAMALAALYPMSSGNSVFAKAATRGIPAQTPAPNLIPTVEPPVPTAPLTVDQLLLKLTTDFIQMANDITDTTVSPLICLSCSISTGYQPSLYGNPGQIY